MAQLTKTITKKEQHALDVAARKRDAYVAKVRRMVNHCSFFDRDKRIANAEIVQAYESTIPAETFAAQIAAREPVGAAVHALKVDAIKAAAQKAVETIALIRKHLEECGWDINIAAPYPYRETNEFVYRAKIEKWRLYNNLTQSVKSSGRMGEPRIVEMTDELCQRYIESREKSAAWDYDEFILKLVAKVGPALGATLNGNHVWSSSRLVVHKPDGTIETWFTQQIWNRSVLGLDFPQWPTRKLKP